MDGVVALVDFFVPEECRQQGLLGRFLDEAEEFCGRSGYHLVVREIVGLFMLYECSKRGYAPSSKRTLATQTREQEELLRDPQLLERCISRLVGLLAQGHVAEAQVLWDSQTMRGMSIMMRKS